MRASNPLEEKVIELAEPAAAALGLRLVRVRLSGLRRKQLQIMAERMADGGMSLEDCEALSHALSPVLEAADPIPDEYVLEVSSPGIDRPLVRIEDFVRFEGHDAKLETVGMISGRRRFKGVLSGVAEGAVRIETQDGPFEVPFDQIGEARLLLTERLIQEDLKRAKAAEDEDSKRKAS